ncbi:MAG TPA: GNAT family N-acetyltransferase [Burkholderiales bacterium]|nr:GNAT family N-acetyltransferase [Burkholderiales bacterium]
MIRLALPDEAEAVRALSAAAYLPVYLPLYGRPPMPAREDYAPRIARGEVWIAEIDARLAAVLVLERQADHMLLYSIAIQPVYQGRGLAAKLLAFADVRAKEAGFSEIRLYTNEKMLRNQSIYARAGYREIGRRLHPNQSGLMLVDMAKTLD